MQDVKPSTIAMWVFIIGVSGALTWFAFIKHNIDPYDLGIASSVRGSVTVLQPSGTTTTYNLIECGKQSQDSVEVEFSGDGGSLTMWFGTGSYPKPSRSLISFSSKEFPMRDSLTCQAAKFLVTQSKTRMGRGTNVGHSNYSGDIDMVCENAFTKNQYHVDVNFQNCRN